MGPGFKLGSTLGGSSGFLLLDSQIENALSRHLSTVVGVGLGLADTIPIRLRGGFRYRIANLDLPLSPFGQVQLTLGRLYDVIGANLNVAGIRAGIGIDYFLTANLATGLLIAADLGTTMGQRPAFFGTLEILAVALVAL